MRSRPAWAAQGAQGQPGLHSWTVSTKRSKKPSWLGVPAGEGEARLRVLWRPFFSLLSCALSSPSSCSLASYFLSLRKCQPTSKRGLQSLVGPQTLSPEGQRSRKTLWRFHLNVPLQLLFLHPVPLMGRGRVALHDFFSLSLF